jgi:hypothetical protein
VSLIDKTVPRLSTLIIDADKDWLKYNITNFGPGGVDLYSLLTAHAARHLAGGADAISGIARSQLEYPTVGVELTYLLAIGKAVWGALASSDANMGRRVVTVDAFTDKAVKTIACIGSDFAGIGVLRFNAVNSHYYNMISVNAVTADHKIEKIVPNAVTTLATEAVDLTAKRSYTTLHSISGSTLKSFRSDATSDDLPSTPQISATDTSLASGGMGVGDRSDANVNNTFGYGSLLAPASASPPARGIIELNVEGSGKPDDPFRPSMSKSLTEISTLRGLPDFLYQEARKYDILKTKGFTEDEMRLVFGYIPQHQVDLDAVTWGAFELHPDKASTVVITITGDNPYKLGAIDRQKDKAKRTFAPPRSYYEAVSLYNTLKVDYPHWLAGVHNFAYQTLGLEIFDWMQNIDFYYGELIEHKTHYQQLKQVPDLEIRNRLNELMDRLSKVTALVDERDKHIMKAKEVLARGW